MLMAGLRFVFPTKHTLGSQIELAPLDILVFSSSSASEPFIPLPPIDDYVAPGSQGNLLQGATSEKNFYSDQNHNILLRKRSSESFLFFS